MASHIHSSDKNVIEDNTLFEFLKKLVSSIDIRLLFKKVS